MNVIELFRWRNISPGPAGKRGVIQRPHFLPTVSERSYRTHDIFITNQVVISLFVSTFFGSRHLFFMAASLCYVNPEHRDSSIQPYFFCCPGRSISWQHRCIDNPDSVCVSGQSIPIEKRIGTPSIQPFFFFVRAKKLCGASLHRPRVPHTILDL